DRPEWSPDGKRVLYRSDRTGRAGTLWWQPWDGSGPAELLIGSRDIWEAVLTPDGQSVVYRSGTAATADIWYRRLSGDTTDKPLANSKFTEMGPRLSPDGHWLAYQSN